MNDATPRRYVLRGPDSGGIHFIEVRGDTLTHEGSGECAPDQTGEATREWVSVFLLSNEHREDLAPVLRDMRADLDGDYRVALWTVRFRRGHPVTATADVYCANVGRGHRCSEHCAGPVNTETPRRFVEQMVGRPVRVTSLDVVENPAAPEDTLAIIGLYDSALDTPALRNAAEGSS